MTLENDNVMHVVPLKVYFVANDMHVGPIKVYLVVYIEGIITILILKRGRH